MRHALRASALALLVGIVALPGSATAGVRFGADLSANANSPPSCPGMATQCSAVLTGVSNGERFASPIDGVVTVWRTRAAVFGDITFQVVRRSGTSYRVVGTDTQSAQQDTVNDFFVSIPVREGDLLGLEAPGANEPLRTVTGASIVRFAPPLGSNPTSISDTVLNAELLVNATVEPDADGDGFGDDSQDDCPTNAGTQGACSGTLVGPVLNGDLQWTVGLQLNQNTTFANGEGASPDGSRIPSDGVIVRWRIRSTTGGWAPQVVRPEAGGTYRSVITGAKVQVAAPNDQAGFPPYIRSFPTRLPVKSGDILGVNGDPQSQTVAKGGGPVLVFGPALADGESGTPSQLPFLLPVNADLEPDADGDGFGDITQDGCPASSATQGSCPPDPPPPPPLDPFGVADLARGSLRYAGGRVLRVPLECPATAERCRGVLEARANVRGKKAVAGRTIRLGRARFSIAGGRSKTVRVRLSRAARRVLRGRRTRVTMVIRPTGPGPVRRSRVVLRQPR